MFASAGSWDRWQFWDVDTATPCFWQTRANNRQRSNSLAASIDVIEEIGRTPSDPYPSGDNDPFKVAKLVSARIPRSAQSSSAEQGGWATPETRFSHLQVTPPCVGLELFDSWQDRPSRTLCAHPVRTCATVTVGSILVVGLLAVVFWFFLGGAELLEYHNYKSVDRLLNVYPSPKGSQRRIHFRSVRAGFPGWLQLLENYSKWIVPHEDNTARLIPYISDMGLVWAIPWTGGIWFKKLTTCLNTTISRQHWRTLTSQNADRVQSLERRLWTIHRNYVSSTFDR